ncbi:uncharacterized protein SETTUDRAFT_107956 [Exserohilum turcica Et28A]|uniref:Glyoxalase-like domain-containing protein n=1 Tax=Exserohilum turcicum (strain 28A) TaxID=671987 RepID=R0KG88_EXST2|nr:uncharacterized protein SETTUDRAFT_107956 [Exserohilum turcica Et28A]EOA88309.1 hypothetical protein SETTUDRAFT_107956 [Exserohilum turcica Et28A]
MKLDPAPTRLRQIALVVRDLEGATQQLTHILGTNVVFEDPAVEQWGLKNVLLPLGGDLIEIVSPTKSGTTAGRLLDKRGDGGYMIIMQTEDAEKRRDHIKANNLARVIFEQQHEDAVCVQYHPKDIKGGMIPELDSHKPGPTNPTPLKTRFSPWHACGSNVESYTPGMKQTGHLSLEGCVLCLQPGDVGHEAAARQWEEVFGVARSRDLLAFTNARLGFVRGRPGLAEGLVSITVGVQGKEQYESILERARKAGICSGRCIEMCGVKWYLTLTGSGDNRGKL